MTIGEKIQYYRKKRKMSQENLAVLSHLSKSAINKYESGDRIPKDKHIEKIAIALQVSPIALYDITIRSDYELLLYLYKVGSLSNIKFQGNTDENGNYLNEQLTISFDNPLLSNFLCDWANRLNQSKSLKKTAQLTRSEDTKDTLMKEAKQIEESIETELILDKMAEEYFNKFSIPKFDIDPLSKSILSIKTYSDFIMTLFELTRTSIKFECYGITERFWDYRAIITLDKNSIDKRSIAGEKRFYNFLIAVDQLINQGISCESFAYEDEGEIYYRYILKDKTLALAMEVITDAINTPWQQLSHSEKEKKEAFLLNKIMKYNTKITIS